MGPWWAIHGGRGSEFVPRGRPAQDEQAASMLLARGFASRCWWASRTTSRPRPTPRASPGGRRDPRPPPAPGPGALQPGPVEPAIATRDAGRGRRRMLRSGSCSPTWPSRTARGRGGRRAGEALCRRDAPVPPDRAHPPRGPPGLRLLHRGLQAQGDVLRRHDRIPDPAAEALAGVAIHTADPAWLFGLAPRVAMLSFSSFGTSPAPSPRRCGAPQSWCASAAGPDD